MTKIRIDIDDITFGDYLEISNWCKRNLQSFSSDYIDWGGYLNTWWVFDHESDATLFALRWS